MWCVAWINSLTYWVVEYQVMNQTWFLSAEVTVGGGEGRCAALGPSSRSMAGWQPQLLLLRIYHHVCAHYTLSEWAAVSTVGVLFLAVICRTPPMVTLTQGLSFSLIRAFLELSVVWGSIQFSSLPPPFCPGQLSISPNSLPLLLHRCFPGKSLTHPIPSVSWRTWANLFFF